MDKKLIVSLLAVAALVIAGPSPGWAQKAPIKIGFLAPVTGGGAAVGKDMTSGFMMYIEENGNQFAGRKVEVIVEDTQGDPAQALTRLRKLVESDKVHVVAGAFLASEGYALRRRWTSTRSPRFFPSFRPTTSRNASRSSGWFEAAGRQASRTTPSESTS